MVSIRCIFVVLEIQHNQNSFKHWNTKQFEQICFVYNEIRLCDSNVHNKGKWVVCEFKSAGDDLYVVKQYLIIHISGVGHIRQKSDTIDLAKVNLLTENVKIRMCLKQKSSKEVLNDFMKKNLNWSSYTEVMHTFWISCYKIGCFLVNIKFYPRLDIHMG